jgi:molybdopterin-guanine dinucleotide biosynthesis protein A
VAWWNRELRAAVETALAAGLLAVRDVLDGRPLVEVRPAAPRAGDDVLTNVNRIADLPAEPPD